MHKKKKIHSALCRTAADLWTISTMPKDFGACKVMFRNIFCNSDFSVFSETVISWGWDSPSYIVQLAQTNRFLNISLPSFCFVSLQMMTKHCTHPRTPHPHIPLLPSACSPAPRPSTASLKKMTTSCISVSLLTQWSPSCLKFLPSGLGSSLFQFCHHKISNKCINFHFQTYRFASQSNYWILHICVIGSPPEAVELKLGSIPDYLVHTL